MDIRELLGLIVEHPFFLTDNYFIQIKKAVGRSVQNLGRQSRGRWMVEAE
jgi:hypothetical protein